MILDSLAAIDTYIAVFPQLQTVKRILASGLLKDAEPGSYKTEDLFVRYNVNAYMTHEKGLSGYEVHHREADVQIILSGKELIDIADSSSMKERSTYDSGKDAQFFDGERLLRYTASPGFFAVFLPGEAHEPCITSEKPQSVRKVVFKLLLHP
jgi:YhcH/YjgK/YiaL family protein